MPIAKFQMPDGRVARFEVPEGTTPEQAQAQFQQFVASQQPQPQQESPDYLGAILRTLPGMQGLSLLSTPGKREAATNLE